MFGLGGSDIVFGDGRKMFILVFVSYLIEDCYISFFLLFVLVKWIRNIYLFLQFILILMTNMGLSFVLFFSSCWIEISDF